MHDCHITILSQLLLPQILFNHCLLLTMQPPAAPQAANNSPTAHHMVAAINADGMEDDTSSLSATENSNARSMRLLHQYFMSLAQTGSVRSIVDEKDMVTTKVSLSFKQVKFINADIKSFTKRCTSLNHSRQYGGNK